MLSELYAIRKSYASRKSLIEGIVSPTLVVGLIAGGINTNVVPDKVTFRIDRRVIPEEDAAEAEATLTRQIRDAAAKWPGIALQRAPHPARRPVRADSRPGDSSSPPSRAMQRGSWAKR